VSGAAVASVQSQEMDLKRSHYQVEEAVVHEQE
jgi:hypothetical protein